MQTAQVNSVQDIGIISAVSRIRRDGYVSNLDPAFKRPEQHKGRPVFLKKCANYAAKRDVLNWGGFRVLNAVASRVRNTNLHRRKAINALCQAICHYVNIATWEIECPVIELTRQCELNTISAKGIESISRGARALQQLQKMGIIEGELIWDRSAGTWLTKYLAVTELFFEMIGIGKDEAIKQQELRFEGIRAGMTPSEAGQLSLTKYRELRKLRSIQKSFEIRRNKLTSKREYARAKRIAALPIDEQRREVAGHMWLKMKTGDIKSMPPSMFDQMVSREMRRLQAIATDPPPKD